MNVNLDLEAFDKFWALISDKVDNWLELAIQHIPNVIVAVLVVCVFALIAKIATSLMRKVFRRSMESQQIADLIVSILRVFILAIGAFVALELLGLKGTVTSLLAGAGIIGLALGFAFQDMTENLIAGIAMGIRKPFQLGDIISADGVFGTVKAINLRNTLIETFSGQMEVVPNKVLFRNVLTNFTRYQKRRVDIPVGISYADDPEKAREVIVEAINACDFVRDPDQTAVYAEGFGDSSVNLTVWFWIDYPGETGYMEARHQGIVKVKQALEKADILIPFPIRTLEFDAKGGTTLEEIVDGGISNMSDYRPKGKDGHQAKQAAGEQS
ncbi:MAG: mechanosensitive ion channel protein [Oleiphilus sp.]|nr:MAG: mechanosensitive ion channel protein [Oleiphilus sp.]